MREKRLNRLREFCAANACEASIITDKINLYYYTGMHLSAGMLIVDKASAYLIVDARYFEICQSLTGIETLNKEDASTGKLLSDYSTVAFDSTTVFFQQHQELLTLAEKTQFLPFPRFLQQMRIVKDAHEIALLTKAGELAAKGMHYVEGLLKDHLTEHEIAKALEVFWLMNGADCLSFEPIIAVGAHSSMPHYRAGNGTIASGKHVLVDIGVCLNGYHSDLTRIFHFGEPNAFIQELEEIVFEAYSLAESLCRPGVSVGALDDAARQSLALNGYDKQFTHSLGHGVGLEVHELPMLRGKGAERSTLLEPGMVLTLEPGIYLPGIGGVRYENTVIVTDTACQPLTAAS